MTAHIPADADPFAMCAAAAEHVAAGRAAEIEVEWWADDTEDGVPGGAERRMTITFRSPAAVFARQAGFDQVATRQAAAAWSGQAMTEGLPAEQWAAPDDISGLDDAG